MCHVSERLRLWFERPAEKWENALPIGNGRIGGMVFGGDDQERIQLNEDTLWSGFPRDKNNYDAIRHLEEARDLVRRGEWVRAQNLIRRHMLGPWSEAYQPLGNLYLRQRLDTKRYQYRELCLDTAVAGTVYEGDGVRFTREAFVSPADQVMVVRLSGDRPGRRVPDGVAGQSPSF